MREGIENKHLEEPILEELIIETQEQEPVKEKIDIELAKEYLTSVFRENDDGQKRIEPIIKRVAPFLGSEVFDGDKIRQAIEECASIGNEKKFVERVILALEPLITYRKAHPKDFEEIRWLAEGNKLLNDLLYYNKNGNGVKIHLSSAEGISAIKLRRSVLDGLEKLAQEIKDDEEITEVRATSWIVAKNPRLLEKMGFEVEGEIDEELKTNHFSDETRPISTAVMSKEEFLKRYLK